MKNSSPLVSILVPFYNPGIFFKKTIASLEGLNYPNIEYIFIDDGSTDDSCKYLEDFSRPYELLTQNNQGVLNLATTINKCLLKASGEYVQMFPSDDLIYKNKLSKQVEIFDELPSVCLVFSKMHIIDKDDRIVAYSFSPTSIKLNSVLTNEDLLPVFVSNYFLSQPTTLIRTSLLRKIGGFCQPNNLYAEDLPTHLALLKEGDFYFQDEFTAAYRIHDKQMTNLYSEKMIMSDFLYIESWSMSQLPHFRNPKKLEYNLKVSRHKALLRVLIRKPTGYFVYTQALRMSPFNPKSFCIFLIASFVHVLKLFFPRLVMYRLRRTCKP